MVSRVPESVINSPRGKEEGRLSAISIKQLLEAGVHFGHQTSRWNPKMREYIFGERNGIHIIDLQKTLRLFKEAVDFLTDLGAQGKEVLFVGTKRQAQEAIEEDAKACGMHFVTNRWLGGLLTNFATVRNSIKRYKELEALRADGYYTRFSSKKEIAKLERERKKLEKNLRGIRDLERLPDAMFVIDSDREVIAVKEANRLGIPVIAIVDTNCDPDLIDYVIPGNDDALRSVKLFTNTVSEAVAAGRSIWDVKVAEERRAREEAEREEAARAAAAKAAAEARRAEREKAAAEAREAEAREAKAAKEARAKEAKAQGEEAAAAKPSAKPEKTEESAAKVEEASPSSVEAKPETEAKKPEKKAPEKKEPERKAEKAVAAEAAEKTAEAEAETVDAERAESSESSESEAAAEGEQAESAKTASEEAAEQAPEEEAAAKAKTDEQDAEEKKATTKKSGPRKSARPKKSKAESKSAGGNSGEDTQEVAAES